MCHVRLYLLIYRRCKKANSAVVLIKSPINKWHNVFGVKEDKNGEESKEREGALCWT